MGYCCIPKRFGFLDFQQKLKSRFLDLTFTRSQRFEIYRGPKVFTERLSVDLYGASQSACVNFVSKFEVDTRIANYQIQQFWDPDGGLVSTFKC